MLPAGSSLLCASPSMAVPYSAPAPDMTVADMEELKALAASMIANGEFDKPAYVDHRFDLNADGVMDPIAVAPGTCLDGNGTVSVIDGATNQLRFELHAPPREVLFGEQVAIVEDCNADLVNDVAIASGLIEGGLPELRVRVYSGLRRVDWTEHL